MKMMVVRAVAALAVIASWSTAEATTLSGNLTADNLFDAYISTDDNVLGTLITSGISWPTTVSFSGQALTAGVTNYLHIVATDQGKPDMFIGSFSLSDSLFHFANATQNLLTNATDWRSDVARTAWVTIDGDRVTIRNFRNCNYRTETSFTNCWADKTVYLSQLKGADFFFTNWGPRWIGHPIVSFQFGDNDHIAFSIEARYKAGQSYSAILGFFRQYELIFITADERDVIRLRTNYRKGEEVRLYRTTVSPDTARRIFLIYVDYLNQLRDHPEWYNALTKNCTTTLDRQIAADVPNPKAWSYQLILNGSLDGLLYSRGRLVTGGLPYEVLREREHINKAANAANESPDFSTVIRLGRIGF